MAVESLIARVGANTTGFDAAMRRVGTTAKATMGGITQAAKKAALALGGLTAAAAVVGSKFEFELTKTATVAQAFGKELDALRHKARELGSTTEFTAAQAAAGMYDLASAGMNTTQILATTEHAMKLATATGTEMSQATHLIASSLKQFGLEAEESKRVVDTYAQAITSSQLTMERLTEAMKYAGTTGSSLGWSIEQTTAAVAQFANLGLEGGMAGTNLRMAMVSLAKQTDRTKEALDRLGLTYEQIDPTQHNFGEVLKTLGERFMSTKDAVDLFGSRAGLNMRMLAELAKTGKIDMEGFTNALIKAQEGQGRTAEMAARLWDTFRNKWKAFVSALQNTLIEIFYVFEASGKSLFDYLADALNRMTRWVAENRRMIQELAVDMATMIVKAATTAYKPVLALKFAWQGIKQIVLGVLQFIVDKIAWMSTKVAELLENTPLLSGKAKMFRDFASDMEGFSQHLSGSIDEQNKILDDSAQAYLDNAAAVDKTKESIVNYLSTLKSTVHAAGPQGIGAPTLGAPVMPKGPSAEDVAAVRAKAVREEQLGAAKSQLEQLNEVERQAGLTKYEKMMEDSQKEIDLVKSKYDSIYQAAKSAGASQEQLLEITASKEKAVGERSKRYNMQLAQERIVIAQQMVGGLTSTMEQLYTSGLVRSKKMFRVIKAFKITEAIINTAAAVMQALGNWPPPISYALAAVAAVQGAVQVAMIARQAPPAYREGGIVRGRGDGAGTLIRAGEGGDEAIVPMRGGKIDVRVMRSRSETPTVVENHYHNHLENATFLDQGQLAAALETIAINAYRKDYLNDGITRRMR